MSNLSWRPIIAAIAILTSASCSGSIAANESELEECWLQQAELAALVNDGGALAAATFKEGVEEPCLIAHESAQDLDLNPVQKELIDRSVQTMNHLRDAVGTVVDTPEIEDPETIELRIAAWRQSSDTS